jgi:hypothetical protein
MNDLEILARKYGTDKRTNDPGENIYHDYTNLYYPCLCNRIQNTHTLLEIGVWRGYSHKMWEEFFQLAQIYGIDDYLEPTCLPKEEIESDRIKIIVGNQSDQKLIDDNFKDNSLDIVIDDGSHNSWDQQKSFLYLWPKLKSGGLYFIEDLGVCAIRKFREFDDMQSSTYYWLNSMRSREVPFSYYISKDDMKKVCYEISTVNIIGELGIIEKL